VKAGEVIASVGASGGLDESGLYFEIRYRGQPQDPSRWMGAKQ
jgi:murein hydrolase activator